MWNWRPSEHAASVTRQPSAVDGAPREWECCCRFPRLVLAKGTRDRFESHSCRALTSNAHARGSETKTD